MSFRDKLLPGTEEEWRLKIKGANGDKVMAEMVAGPDCSDQIPEPFAGQLDLNLRAVRLENLGRGSYIRERFNLEEGKFVFSHKTLYGVPGNQFFMHFRKHVLDEEYDERDLLFINDHKLAKWVV